MRERIWKRRARSGRKEVEVKISREQRADQRELGQEPQTLVTRGIQGSYQVFKAKGVRL